MEIQKVGVLGCGLMGAGIAQTAASAGFETIVREVSDDLLAKGFARIEKSLARFAEKGTITPEQQKEIRGRLTGTTSLDQLADCDIIIEAIIENLDTKRETYVRLDDLCKVETIFASNTSSLSITEMMNVTSAERQKRFIGMHFFNPVPLMKLVEVVRTILTDDEVYEQAVEFGRKLGKTAVRASDKTGFIVNRLLVPYLLDAIRALEEGVGSTVDIDNAMKLGCGYPMGPLTLGDFVGLDTTYYIAEIMFNEFREKRFAPPPLLKRMVMAGLYGRKTGRGFYDYTKDPKNPTPMNLFRPAFLPVFFKTFYEEEVGTCPHSTSSLNFHSLKSKLQNFNQCFLAPGLKRGKLVSHWPGAQKLPGEDDLSMVLVLELDCNGSSGIHIAVEHIVPP